MHVRLRMLRLQLLLLLLRAVREGRDCRVRLLLLRGRWRRCWMRLPLLLFLRRYLSSAGLEPRTAVVASVADVVDADFAGVAAACAAAATVLPAVGAATTVTAVIAAAVAAAAVAVAAAELGVGPAG